MSTRRPSRRWPRSSGSVLAAAILAVVAVLMPGATPTTRAAEDDLRLTADATYRVVPADGEVRVRVDWQATNLQPNSVRRTPSGIVTTRYFYDRILFAVPIEAREIRATSGGSRLRVSTRDLEFSRQVTVRIPNLYYRQTRAMRVDFVLPGGKPRSDSDVRVGRAFTTFTAWAWGDANRGTVRIILPSGFDAEGYGDDVTQRTHDDRVELTSGRIADPFDWYRVVVADRPTQLTHTDVDTGGRKIVVQAWPEDVTWRERVSDVLTNGLPELEKMIGRPWPIGDDELVVTEIHTPLLEGYAGFFDPSTAAITMSEDLDDQTILHEASHAWFHGGFLTDRWITEGLAEHYADRVRETLGLSDEFDPEAIARTAKGEFPLNRWPNPERIDDQETQDQETYGYRASYTVIRRIAEAIGDDGMRAVLAAVDRGESAYVGDGRPDRTGATMDWKRFLDLVQDVGGMEGADDLFSEWAVSGSEAGLLRSRELARTAYEDLEESGAAWAVPKGARAMMSLWRFADATSMFDAAEPVIALRDDLESATTGLALTPPADVERRFEDATKVADLDAIGDTLEARIAAARDVAAARDALAAVRSPLTALGLIGETPDSTYGSARAAFEAGDVAAATAASAATVAVLAGAESAGVTRALVIGGVSAALVILLVIAAALVVRGRRRRRLALGAASAGASTTLPATSGPALAPPVAPPSPSTPMTPHDPAPGAEPD